MQRSSSIIITAALLFGLSTVLGAANARSADLTLTVDNIESVEGTLNWVLYDTEENYRDNDAAVFSARAKVSGETMRFTVHALPPGRYAIKLFHDANANGELDSNALGLPTEGYGFSNNAGRFGPPDFEDASFGLGDTSVNVQVRVR